MRVFLINSNEEWVSVLTKLYSDGYRWSMKHSPSTYSPALSIDDLISADTQGQFGVNPIVVVSGLKDHPEKQLFWCHLNSLSVQYPDEHFKLIRREKLKKLNKV